MFRLTRLGYYADFALLPALVALLMVIDLGAAPALCAAGFVAWTLAEYLIHRFVFHAVPWLSNEHDRHHATPRAFIGAGSYITLPSLAALWLILRAVLPAGPADAVSIGAAIGYFLYIVVHDRLHHGDVRPGQWLYAAFHRHALHHRGRPVNFGVVTPFWDMVFQTYER